MLTVTFHLEGMTEAEYYRGCDEAAPAFAEIPGLIAKTWLADPATNTYGGVYTFREEASREAYVAVSGIGDADATNSDQSRCGIGDGYIGCVAISGTNVAALMLSETPGEQAG